MIHKSYTGCEPASSTGLTFHEAGLGESDGKMTGKRRDLPVVS